MIRELTIIGPGRVGTAIGVLAHGRGWRVRAVAGRDPAKSRMAAERIGPEVLAKPVTAVAVGAPLVLLTVSDSAIGPLVGQLAATGALEGVEVLAHCSGALSADVLAPARDVAGCGIGSAHPLQTFPSVDAALKRLPGAFWVCEGDPGACTVLEELGAAMGLRSLRIASGDKPGYHAMAVTASNYLVALMDAALTLGEEVGMERKVAWRALTPLVQATLDNIDKLGTAGALTGPVERGDELTVRRHLGWLAGNPALGSLYRRLGAWTAELAQHGGSLDAEAAGRLRSLFAGESRQADE